MLQNYVKIALRNLLRHKGYSFINIAGLAMGLAACLLILLFVTNELRYDRFHEKADRIVRVVNHRTDTESGAVSENAYTPVKLGPTLTAAFPEVEASVRFFEWTRPLVRHGEREFFEERIYLADSTVFDVFSFELVRGNPQTALDAPSGVVLSESLARKYFGAEDPLGRELTVDNEVTLQVTGVMRDLPAESHLQIDLLGAFSILRATGVSPERLDNWRWQQFYTYAALAEGVAPADLEEKLAAYARTNVDPQTEREGFRHDLRLQPLKEVHLHSGNLRFDVPGMGNAAYVYGLTVVALFVLLIACFNFVNLSTARSLQRAREVGMRKVMGADRGQLIRQFLGESVLLAGFAMLLALVLVQAALPLFNGASEKSLSLPLTTSPLLVLALLGGALGIGLLAGSYPALYLSGFQPIRVLKGQTASGRLSPLRRGLVVVQFTISIGLIAGAAVVYTQLQYLQEKNLGFEKEQIVVVPMRGEAMEEGYEALKQELVRSPAVEAASASWGIPGGIFAGDAVRLPGSDVERGVSMFVVDYDYLETYGMTMAAGRAFSRSFPSDAEQAFILNETGARSFGWTPEEALGRRLMWDRWDGEGVKEGEVVGVVRDFHVRSLHQEVEPVVLHIFPPAYGNISVRVRPEHAGAALTAMEATWKAWAPEWPFEYTFLDAAFAEMYRAEEEMGRLAGAFSLLAVLIACLGMLGLCTFAAERRTKEIGVRKVLGASVPGILLLLTKDYARLILVAFVLACPVAYFAVRRWLDTFEYRIEVGAGPFLLAGFVVFAVAMLTISYRSVRAAMADPVKSLRYE